jgi:hypothetical protein
VHRRLGFCFGRGLTRDQAEKAWEMTVIVRSELGTEDVVEREHAHWRRVDQVHLAIMAASPRTLIGVAVQARAAAMLVHSEFWDQPKQDLDWEKMVIRNLIESVCAAAGVALPVELTNEGSDAA